MYCMSKLCYVCCVVLCTVLRQINKVTGGYTFAQFIYFPPVLYYNYVTYRVLDIIYDLMGQLNKVTGGYTFAHFI